MHPWLKPWVEGAEVMAILATDGPEGVLKWAAKKTGKEIRKRLLVLAETKLGEALIDELKETEIVSKMFLKLLRLDLRPVWNIRVGESNFRPSAWSAAWADIWGLPVPSGSFRPPGSWKDGKNCKSEIQGLSGELWSLHDFKMMVHGQYYDDKHDCCWLFIITKETTMKTVNKADYTELLPEVHTLVKKRKP